jgi:hypothetical protein
VRGGYGAFEFSHANDYSMCRPRPVVSAIRSPTART